MASRNRKQKSQRRRSQRRSKKQGGAMLTGAPLAYSLADDWSSKMSNGQGGDYLKYHVGQHGGALEGAPLSEIGGSGLPSALRGPAHIGGLDKAFSDIAGLKDQAGGRRRSRRSQRKSQGGRRRSQRSQRKSQGGRRRSQRSQGGRRRSQKKQGGRRSQRRSQRKSQGGALGYAPFGGASMLLDGAGYAKAGLTPEWKGGVEFDAAKMRAAM